MTLEEAFPLLKVGMKVREVPGKGFCAAMDCTGEYEVTSIGKEKRRIWFQNCWHYANERRAEIEILKNPDGTPWKAKNVFPLNAGDRVKVVKDLGWDCEICSHVGWAPEMDKLVGQEFIIESIDTHVVPAVRYGGYRFCHHWLKKIERELVDYRQAVISDYLVPSDYPDATYDGTTMVFRPTIKEILAQKKGTFMDVIKSLKAKLTPTDRTLVKHGFLDSKGNRTEQYEQELWETVKARLVADEDTTEFRTELANALNEKE